MKRITKRLSLLLPLILVFSILLCGCVQIDHAQTDLPEVTPKNEGNVPGTIHEPISASETVQRDFYSATQKTHFVINAVVSAPDVEQVPVYETRAREFTKEEISAAASAIFGDTPYEGSTDYHILQFTKSASFPYDCTQYECRFSSLETAPGLYFDMPVSFVDALMRVTPSGVVRKAVLEYQAVNEELNPQESYIRFDPQAQMPRKPDNSGARGCSMTEAEARAQADTIVASFAPDLRFAAIGILPCTGTASQEAWIVFYTRGYELPYTFTSYMCSDGGIGLEYAVDTEEECLKIVLNDDGIQAMRYVSPYEITGTISTDAQLLPFSEIMAAAEAVLPLKFGYFDSYESQRTVNITQISLGYMRVMQKDQPDKLMLVPVWDFFGNHTNGSNVYEDWPCNSHLTINALDGTVIDRVYGY